MKNTTNTGTLEVATPTDREIVMTRAFDAPRSLVFDAWTKPELLKRWLGPRGWSLEVRDAVRDSGMERGVAEGYDKLAELLESALRASDEDELEERS